MFDTVLDILGFGEQLFLNAGEILQSLLNQNLFLTGTQKDHSGFFVCKLVCA